MMVAPIIGEGTCLSCGKPVFHRLNLPPTKHCSVVCRERSRKPNKLQHRAKENAKACAKRRLRRLMKFARLALEAQQDQAS
jgi:hypothetical protein